MIAPAIPLDEAARLKSLQSLNILDTLPEERFDRLTRLARRMFGVSSALVSLVDANRQWFKSRQGLDATETPRDVSFCGHAILGDDILMVPDALLDERFRDNPLVVGAPNIRFYAGRPLRGPGGGHTLGTLCLLDPAPRGLDDEERRLLNDLAQMAEQELAAIHQASIDELTGLSNRRGFLALGQHALALCTRLQVPATLLFIDLDGFKPINDRFGHAEGDRALATFASVLLETFRDSDVLARLGGDEFVVLLTNCREADCAPLLARLQQALDASAQREQRGYALRFSHGAASGEPDGSAPLEELLAAADALMYRHKARRAAR